MPGAYLAYLANGVAFVTAAWLLVSYVLDARARPRATSAATTDVGCPPAPDGDEHVRRRRARAAPRRRRRRR